MVTTLKNLFVICILTILPAICLSQEKELLSELDSDMITFESIWQPGDSFGVDIRASVFSNPKNPYEYIGKIHNEGLDYLRENQHLFRDEAEMQQVVINYLRNKNFIQSSIHEYHERHQLIEGYNNSTDKTRYLIKHGSSEKFGKYLQMIEQLCQVGHEKADHSKLISFENEIIQRDQELSKADQKALAISASVCRFSSSYTYLSQEDFGETNNPVPYSRGGPWQFVKSDLQGAALGYIAEVGYAAAGALASGGPIGWGILGVSAGALATGAIVDSGANYFFGW